MALCAMCHGDAMEQRVWAMARYAEAVLGVDNRAIDRLSTPRMVVRAEGVGFEPTVACATTVFETVRFGRSRIPPSTRLPAALGGEEGAEQLRHALALDTRGDLDLMVETGIGTQVVERPARTGPRIGRAEDETLDARRDR